MIGHVLKLWLKKYHMSVSEFSSFSGYERKVIYRWLNSESIPTKKSIRNIVETIAHHANWTETAIQFAYVSLLNMRDKEYEFKKNRKKA